ncbi:MAG: metal ABC transporter ATP-binding protein [Candidatus Lokiarchaeota archaeon]|nr:metal ABC transporter ATP-binding protein [Candidatus Lokiarchaeota archaeon]
MKNHSQIILRNANTTYEGADRPTLHNISLKIEEGEYILILGPNGAGKTTFLETINGLLKITSGDLKVFGHSIKKKRTWIQKKVGYVIQGFNYDPFIPFLVKDIIMMGRIGKIGVLNFPSKKDWNLAWDWLKKLNMYEFRSRPIGKLSGGQQQKVLIVRALVKEPEILLLDEPYSNLDLKSKKKISNVFKSLNEEKKITILLVSHEISEIPPEITRIIYIKEGFVLYNGSVPDFLKTEHANLLKWKQM